MSDYVDSILEQWARERPDLDVSPIGVIGRMSRLARHFEQEIGRNLAEFGISADEYDVLATLRRNGKPYGLNPSRLLDSMMVSSGTLTYRLDRLEDRGLIERVRDPSDRRGVIARLTPAGKRLVDRASVKHYDGEHRLLSALSRDERETLAGLLRQLAEANDC